MCGNFGFGGLAHVPLAHPVALCALDQIEMDVRFMLRIRAGAEHCCEAMADAVADLGAEILRNRNVGQSDRAAVYQYK